MNSRNSQGFRIVATEEGAFDKRSLARTSDSSFRSFYLFAILGNLLLLRTLVYRFLENTTSSSSPNTARISSPETLNVRTRRQWKFELHPHDLLPFPQGYGSTHDKMAQRQLRENSCAAEGPRASMGVVYGLFNTGTNIMTEMVKQYCSDFKSLTKKCEARIWKHAPWNPEVVKIIHKEIPVIVMAKDPLTWFHSACKTPYQLKYSGELPCEEAVFQSPWSIRGKKYESLMNVYEEYYRLVFNETLGGPGHAQTLIIRYEDLLMSADDVMGRTCAHLGLEKKGTVKIQEKAYKNHGHSSDLDSARARYMHPGYRYEGWSLSNLQKLRETCDQNVLEALGYSFDSDVKYDAMMLSRFEDSHL